MTKRVYTGEHPVVFLTGNVGAVSPGDEIDVPDGHLAAFDARPDIAVPGSGSEGEDGAQGDSGEGGGSDGQAGPRGRRKPRGRQDTDGGEGGTAPTGDNG